ncbi:HIT family protein [Streptomyces sp. NPDC004285]
MIEPETDVIENCEFCKIVASAAPAEILYESDSCLAFFPLNPATKGHTLVIPKIHVRDFTCATPEAFGELSSTTVEISRKLLTVYSPDGINLITSAGRAASQSIMHLHLHLVPRWNNDEVGDIWPPRRHTDRRILFDWAEEFRRFEGGIDNDHANQSS